MFHGPITSNGREATVTERAARSNPQRAVGEAHCELFVTQKVIDAQLKALSTPWWTESSTNVTRTLNAKIAYQQASVFFL